MADRTVLIVEDSGHARDALVRMLAAYADIGAILAVATLAEARAAVAAARYDLAFLDVRLPDGSGAALGTELSAAPGGPALIYLTADPTAAVDAFRQGACDYLLKPLNAADLARALDRTRRARDGAGPAPLMVRSGATTRYVAVELIQAVESAGHHQCVHAAGEVHVVRQPIAALVARLGPGFVRVHRSIIVRAALVQSMETARNGDGIVTMRDGKRFRLSRVHRAELQAALCHR
jgi:two-component system LytT family response regulator